VWKDKDPIAAERLARARAALTTIAEDRDIPLENLLSPDAVRRCAWAPPQPLTEASVAHALAEFGVRPWQIGLTVQSLTAALAE